MEAFTELNASVDNMLSASVWTNGMPAILYLSPCKLYKLYNVFTRILINMIQEIALIRLN